MEGTLGWPSVHPFAKREVPALVDGQQGDGENGGARALPKLLPDPASTRGITAFVVDSCGWLRFQRKFRRREQGRYGLLAVRGPQHRCLRSHRRLRSIFRQKSSAAG